MALAHSPRIVTNGLVLYLDAANPKSYPGSGNTWFDLSVLKNDFTLVGTDFVLSNPKHFSLLDNQNDYIIRSSSDVIGNLNDITIELWFRLDSNPSSFNIISYATSVNNNSLLIIKSSTNIDLWYKASNVLIPFNESDFQIGNFIQFVFVRSGTSVKFYVNSIEKASSNSYFSGAFETGGTFVFGQEQDSPGGGFDPVQDFPGDISNMKIYSKVLSVNEIQRNFNALRGRFGI